VTLGEGNTPLIEAPGLASETGCGRLFIKNEALNPTGSFKARGMAVAVSRLAELGAKAGIVPSAGNAGLALAAYAAAAGIRARIYIPSVTPEGVAEECEAYGAEVRTVQGLLPDASAAMVEEGLGEGEYALSTFREPCRVEGKKTMAFEIESALEGASPDWILFPTGGGTGVVAFWKAYLELEELGWLAGGRPRIAAVQADGCAPVVRAIEEESATVRPWKDPETIASGIRVPASRADRQILHAIRETGGAAVAVDDGSIIDAAFSMASSVGIFPSPEGAAAFSALGKLVSAGAVSDADSVVIVNTADWTRYRFMLGMRPPL
jgi:threonine synthase